uniref:Uncharacterized protein n=1 Tax=Saimiri boliviensis boliviensis TaxID=39432 RepID=A0A2K6S4A3_SAIBB
ISGFGAQDRHLVEVKMWISAPRATGEAEPTHWRSASIEGTDGRREASEDTAGRETENLASWLLIEESIERREWLS